VTRSDDEPPDPRHERPASSVPVALLIGGAVVGLVVLAGCGLVLFGLNVRGGKAPPPEPAVVEESKSVPAEPGRIGFGEPMTIDGLSVRVVSAGIGKARVHADNGTLLVEDKNNSLVVVIELAAANKGRRYEYRTWRAPVRMYATDDLDNVYAGRLGAFSAEYPGFVSSRSLSEGEKVTDTLPFETPDPDAKYVDLDLPGQNAGVDGFFRFRISREQWSKK
jgi:hypothetical protein